MLIKRLKPHVKRILILYWGFLGDTLAALPFLDGLRKTFPRAHITYIIGRAGGHYENAGKLLEIKGIVDTCINSDFSILSKIIRQAPYDLTIDLCSNRTSKLISKLSGCRARIWGRFREVPKYFEYYDTLGKNPLILREKIIQGHRYRVEQFLDVLKFLGVRIGESNYPQISFSLKEARSAKLALRRKLRAKNKDIIIGMQPGGRVLSRLWDCVSYAHLADELSSRYQAKIVVFYAHKEKEFANSVKRGMHHPAVILREDDIRQYSAFIRACDVFISTDGGALHLALAMGVPSVGIFVYPGIVRYWYNYKKRQGLRYVFIKNEKPEGKINYRQALRKRRKKEVSAVLRKVKKTLAGKI
jgi:ADP-heptose:LPS heptosyltransferase